jgi:DNA-binding transcriptional ArsR family regulator
VSPTSTADDAVLKALGHPVRRQVMTLIGEGEASPKELAARLGVALPNLSYHVAILRDLGLIKVVRETPRRGAVEHHYRATRRSVTVREVIQWLLAADEGKPKGWRARTAELDREGVEKVDAAIAKLWTEIDRAEAQSARRAARDDAGVSRHAIGALRSPVKPGL